MFLLKDNSNSFSTNATNYSKNAALTAMGASDSFVLYQLRHGTASEHLAELQRPLLEIKKQEAKRTDASGGRCTKSGQIHEQLSPRSAANRIKATQLAALLPSKLSEMF